MSLFSSSRRQRNTGRVVSQEEEEDEENGFLTTPLSLAQDAQCVICLQYFNDVQTYAVFGKGGVPIEESNSGDKRAVEGGDQREGGQLLVLSSKHPFYAQMMPRALRCGHVFHLNCIAAWATNNSTCPTCRAEIH